VAVGIHSLKGGVVIARHKKYKRGVFKLIRMKRVQVGPLGDYEREKGGDGCLPLGVAMWGRKGMAHQNSIVIGKEGGEMGGGGQGF